jgi:formylglycine-generating enzyme required for sulfatase activity
LLQTHLEARSVETFLDRDLGRGVFDEMLLRRIAESPTFLIILTPNALDRCADEEDWLRKEIVQAISSKRNIIPLLVDSFQFTPEIVRKLDPAIRELSRYQAVVYSRDYFESVIERIVRMVEEDRAERTAAPQAKPTEAGPTEGEQADAERKRKERREAQQIAREFIHKRAQEEQVKRGKAEHAPPAAESRAEHHTVKLEVKTPAHEADAIIGQPRYLRLLLWATSLVVLTVLIFGSWRYRGASGGHQERATPTPTPEKIAETSQPSNTSGDSEKARQNPTVAAGAIETKENPKDGQQYVWIKPGIFSMGCSEGDNECDADEKPKHQIRITKGFWLGQTPVTQAAYQRVMRENPSHFQGQPLPVETVDWNQAESYCKAVSGRLPTEAEWEYAARAGNPSSRYGNLDAIAWYADNSGKTQIDGAALWRDDMDHYYAKLKANGNETHPVKTKQRNAWGLYDMLGNIWEWVNDSYDDTYYVNSPFADPTGPATRRYRVLRGGSGFSKSTNLRASCRDQQRFDFSNLDLGFRCVWEVLLVNARK